MIKKFLKAASFYSVGNAYVALAGFALIPFMTRLIDVGSLGYIFLFQAIIVLASSVIGIGGQAVLQNLYFKADSRFSTYFSSALTNALIAWVILNLLFLFIGNQLFGLLGLEFAYGMLAIFFSIFVFVQSVIHTILQAMSEAKKFLIMVVCTASAGFSVTIILLLYVSHEWQVRIVGIGTGLLIGSAFIIFLIKKIGFSKPKFTEMKELIGIGHPVVIHSFAMLLINQTDKFLLANLKTSVEVGVYGVAAQLASVVTLFGSTLSMAYAPILYKKINSLVKSDQIDIVKIRRLCMAGVVIFSVIIMLIILNYSELIIGSKFPFYATPFILLISASVVFSWYFLYAGYFYQFKQTKLLALISSSIAVINVIVSYILIPEYGLVGAAIGTLVSYLFGWLCAFSFARKCLRSLNIPS